MSSKKEWLELIHAYSGFRTDGVLSFRATDDQGINKYASAKLSDEWWTPIAETFRDFVDPRTLSTLQRDAQEVVELLRQSSGTVWITPKGVQLKSLSTT